jgi:isopentenyl-diphosphate delta-isomerase
MIFTALLSLVAFVPSTVALTTSQRRAGHPRATVEQNALDRRSALQYSFASNQGIDYDPCASLLDDDKEMESQEAFFSLLGMAWATGAIPTAILMPESAEVVYGSDAKTELAKVSDDRNEDTRIKHAITINKKIWQFSYTMSAFTRFAQPFLDGLSMWIRSFGNRKPTGSENSKRYMSTYGEDMDQNDLMESDKLIAVDEKDMLIPNIDLSKRQGHTFNKETPKAALHRAFSFFLFDKDGRMLLTQRAGSKITFPNVWTNTCCSHPLYDMTPNEVDDVPDAYPFFPGIKHAAIRKLQHELGIRPNYIDHDKIQFISRFHYWAADTVTYGNNAPWGEHEVDCKDRLAGTTCFPCMQTSFSAHISLFFFAFFWSAFRRPFSTVHG